MLSTERLKPSRSEYDITIHESSVGIPTGALKLFTSMNEGLVQFHEQFAFEYQEHITNSKQAIIETANLALTRAPKDKPTKVFVLGSGNCFDIPLEKLAEFDQVTLVELNGESTEKAVQRLAPDLQKKISIVVADIAGATKEFTTAIKSTADTSSSMEQFLTEASPIPRTVSVTGGPDLGNDYTFVCSQLIMSQLASFLNDFLQKTVTEKYKERSLHLLNSPDNKLLMNFTDLTATLMKEHINYLAKSVAPEGTIHLADTYARILYPFHEPQIEPMIYTEDIDPTIQKHFMPTPVVKKQWYWKNKPDPDRRDFYVVAQSFQLKSVNEA